MPYAIRETLAAFRRAPLLVLLSALAIGLSLFVAGLFGLTAHNLGETIAQMERRVEVVAYLRENAQRAQIDQVQTVLRQSPQVASVRYVSKAEALESAKRDLEDFREVFQDLDENPLPASLEVSLRPGIRSTGDVEAVAEQLRAYPFVDDVRFGRDWIDKIVALRQMLAGGVSIIGGAFAAVAAIVIATAVRIAVSARREEIAIMRLVGATPGFIQRPFLLEGLATGLIGGGLAGALTYGAYTWIDRTLYEIAWVPSWWVPAGVAVGAVFGLAASALAVRRHLRSV